VSALAPAAFQVWASFELDRLPPVDVGLAVEWERRRVAVADDLASKGSRAAFAPPSRDGSDTETFSAMEASASEGLPLHVTPAGIDFADVPLLLDHLGAPLAELDVARTGTAFTAIGTVDDDHDGRIRAALLDKPHVSPGVRVTRARLVDIGFGVRYVEVTESLLFELSATAEPLSGGTFLYVGSPGVRYWQPPTGEVFTRSERGVFRALSDVGEEAFQKAEAERRAEADRMSAAHPGAERIAFPGTVEVF
jgi:hypothetical protein